MVVFEWEGFRIDSFRNYTSLSLAQYMCVCVCARARARACGGCMHVRACELSCTHAYADYLEQGDFLQC